jgi:hypothetical protein
MVSGLVLPKILPSLLGALHCRQRWLLLLLLLLLLQIMIMLHRTHKAARQALQLPKINHSSPVPGAAAVAAAADYEKIMLHRIHRAAREAQQLAGNYEEWKLKDVDWFKDTTATLRNHLQVLAISHCLL